MRTAQSARQTEAGFTLLEMLVALMLTALAFALLPGILRLGDRVVGAARVFDAGSSRAPALQFVRERIATALPATVRNGQGRRVVSFRGAPEELEFVARAPMAMGLDRAVHYRLAREAGSASGLSVAVSRPGETDAAPLRAEPLALQPGARVQFRYYGRKVDEAEPRWHATWQDEAALPQLVEINGWAKAPTLIELKLAAPY